MFVSAKLMCESNEFIYVVQQIGKDHVLSFRLALGCNASWDNTAPPVR